MSAAGRASQRVAQDAYLTPISAFRPLLPFLPSGGLLWESASGDGRLITAMRDYGLQADGRDFVTDGYNFLKDERRHFGVVTNPPFSLAFEFAQHALAHAQHVYLLLRLNFLESRKRKAWFVEHEPTALFVLSKRPSFVNGRTDATGYCWMVWSPLANGIHHL